MNRMLFLLPALVVAASTGLACTATVGAYPGPYGWENGRGAYGRAIESAYENGYRAVLEQGLRDARENRRYDHARHCAYRSGSWGYDRRYGSRDDYRRAFRQGFAAGYSDGYNRWRGGRAVPRRDPYYGRSPGYPSSRYGYGYSKAFDRGYREGFDKGRDDARDNDRYDPRRHKWYREGDRGYDRDDGPREQYKAAYRDGFLRGYDDGYRDGRYSRSNRGWW